MVDDLLNHYLEILGDMPLPSARDDAANMFDSLFGDIVSSDGEPVDNRAVALDLARRGFAVFPVRDWGDGDGWKPIAKFPERASISTRRINGWWRQWPEARVGLLCGARNGIVALDLDLKNGRDGAAELARLGFPDLAALSPVRVRTPSGGWHLFFKYDARIRNSASRIAPGVDVRSEGGFVIAPGSFKDGARYQIEGAPLGTVDLPAFPESLIPPPEPEREASEAPADVTDDQRAWAAAHLAALADDLAQGEEGGRNAMLNAAAMWAGGAAALGFVNEDDAREALLTAADAAGLRNREAAATFRSGFTAGLKKPIADYPRAIDPDAAFEDQPDDPDAPAGPPDTRRAIIAWMNAKHAVVLVNGKSAAIAFELPGGHVDFGRVYDLEILYADRRVKVGKKIVNYARLWLEDSGRRKYINGVTFAPGGCCDPDTLNLWRGWAVAPDATASCELFLNHVRNVVCGGDPEQYDYLIGWLAHMVQRPGEKPGVVLVLRGSKGAGKDTVAEYVARMIGERHAPTVAHADHITGKFNARLEKALLLHMQEGAWAGDRKAEEVLKYLVSSPRIEIERKGIDSMNVPSVLRMFISANAEWVVPAGEHERRWAVFEVNGSRRGDAEYFSALRSEMEGSGPAALLHYLQHVDLSGFNVRLPPQTAGLVKQKIASLRGLDLWIYEVLSAGILPGDLDGARPWDDAGGTIGRAAFRDMYVEWSRRRRFDGEAATESQFGRRIRELLPDVRDCRPREGGARIWQYVLPSLSQCRASFEKWIGGAIDWSVDE